MNSYIQTYIERDIRLLHNVRDIRTFESFISLCAGRHGQVFNNAALTGQMGGALFEGMVVIEAVKTFANRGQRPDLYFWRSHDGLEVDLIIRVNGRLLPDTGHSEQ